MRKDGRAIDPVTYHRSVLAETAVMFGRPWKPNLRKEKMLINIRTYKKNVALLLLLQTLLRFPWLQVQVQQSLLIFRCFIICWHAYVCWNVKWIFSDIFLKTLVAMLWLYVETLFVMISLQDSRDSVFLRMGPKFRLARVTVDVPYFTGNVDVWKTRCVP